MKYIIFCLLLSSLVACNRKDTYNVGSQNAYMPIYSDIATAKQISLVGPKPFEKGGKIATYLGKIYQVEEDKGIHIINQNPGGTPAKIGFINIPLCKEVTLKDGFIYTNNLDDLIAISLADLNAVTVTTNIAITPTSRTLNAFPNLVINQVPNAPKGSYFECPDANKLVIRWEQKQINNPKCKLL
jgi:hypothetical protein